MEVVTVEDDSTGKSKIQESQNRAKALTAAFVVGLCIGLIISERLYISTNAHPVPSTRTAAVARAHTAAVAQHADKSPQHSQPDEKALMAALKSYLTKVAPDKEVLIAISNRNPLHEGMLDTFVGGIRAAQVPNYLIVALDKETESALQRRDVNTFFMEVPVPKSQAETGMNHALSALKFGIIKRFLQLGWAVLLSDVDVCVLQNPFKALYRDSDVEGMSDGFDDRTAYGAIDGFDDPSMGWSRYAQQYKHFNLNSGLFYLRANERTIDMMARLEERLAREKYWDQTAYNEAMFQLSHGDYKSPQVTVRVMEIMKFMNSKILFKDVRRRPVGQQPPMPVMVHINYHPDKHARMQAVFRYYLKKEPTALDAFPGGSEPGS